MTTNIPTPLPILFSLSLLLLLLPLQAHAVGTGVDLCLYEKSTLAPCSDEDFYCCNKQRRAQLLLPQRRRPTLLRNQWKAAISKTRTTSSTSSKRGIALEGNFDSYSVADTTQSSDCCSKHWWQYPRHEVDAELEECSIRLETLREGGTVLGDGKCSGSGASRS
ncbi:hypothetical protein CERZMDRAFT_87234 [Cercospora zeae-maydis SCOH1-5]|uniref:Hydrophobin n=1 Tax=Cercospora zeae-maydis SCOH1-5 TaxID=717836 RepID=A0A6A6F877_9PEZI|nr:hypothetical protein CERZMDRAFT_87234 [Cercospora zeae-maydis SCOH1-5]